MSNREGYGHMNRLTIEITEQQSEALKAIAAQQGKTVERYVLDRLFGSDEAPCPAWQDLRDLLRARVESGLAGKVSSKRVGDLLEEELARVGAR